jgi:hypothetical protein
VAEQHRNPRKRMSDILLEFFENMVLEPSLVPASYLPSYFYSVLIDLKTNRCAN